MTDRIKVTELKEIEKVLELMVKKGYLKKVRGKYCDSDETKELLKMGMTRTEIGKRFENRWSRRGAR